MNDPLARFPEMMSIENLQQFLGASYPTAREEMLKMPYVIIGTGKKNECRRVAKEHVRRLYSLQEPEQKPLRLVR